MDEDRIDKRARARFDQEMEDARRAGIAARRHPARTDTDPPESGEEPLPSFAKPGIRTGIAHLSAGIAASSKRVAFLVALFGAISTPLSIGFGYWTANQGFVKENRMAQWEANLRAMELSHKATETTVGNVMPRITKIEEVQIVQGQALASLRPIVTATEKPRRSRTDDSPPR